VWSYTLDDGLADSLAEGESRTESFVVTVTDDNGATDTQTVTITINGTNDAPVLTVDHTGSVTEDLSAVAGNLSDSGNLSYTDVDITDTHSVTSTLVGAPAWSGGDLSTVLTASQIAELTNNFAIGGSNWTYNVSNALVQFLDSGETISFAYQVTVTDSHGATDTETVTITISGANDAPVVASTCVWLPSDPAQQTPGFGSGYPLQVSVPTDVDGDNIIVTATNAPSGVFYFDGSSYVAVTSATVLYNPTTGVNLLDDVVYRPTTTVNDTVVRTLNLQASDGTTTTAYSVTINEVPPNRLPATSVSINDDKGGPLTSGNSVIKMMPVSQSFADGINANLSGATIKILTDFQQTNFQTPIPLSERDPTGFNGSSAGTAREKELQIELQIGTNRFVVVEADTTAAKFEQSWFFDQSTGLMAATVSYSNIYLLNSSGIATATTLADFLAQNPVHAGDQWTMSYYDNNGGNFQGRSAEFQFYYNDPGDPGIVVVGDNTKSNLIYGTSAADNLTGGALDDTIIGRGGNDVINGGGGNDTLRGGAGNDTVDGGSGVDLLDLSDASLGVTLTLTQSTGNTVADLTAVGLGVDTYRNIEGIIGSDYDDILVGSAFDDQLHGGAGSDTMTGSGGADTFVIGGNELQIGIDDVITDYHASEGDVVDLTELLGDLAPDTTLDDNYVRVVQDANNSSASLQVDTDGSAGNASGWQTVAVLEDFSVSTEVVKILFNENGTKTTGEV
ncbi:VCBS domain-containing protein, partial [Sinorhizobium sp. 7-81]|uniref:VCBS domain-containing protein n=1 Tax=Sinorhizobium sp. 8-89 TaxID=3049089 RepID=UPI0024C42FE2